MRIVHILHGKVNPEGLNGVSKMGHWMATHQSRLGHAVEVWGLADLAAQTPRSREYKMRLFPITRIRVLLARELRVALDDLGPEDWVQFHSVFCPEFPAIACVLRGLGIPYGVTPHGGYSPCGIARHGWGKRLYFAWREKPYIAGAEWLQAVGAGEIPHLSAIAPAVKIGLIHNGQVLNLLKGIEVAKMESERPVFGFCGRLAIFQKGLDYLVEGFSAYKAEGGPGSLWFVGDGVDRTRVQNMADRAGLGGDVQFFGAMSGTAKHKVIANFDWFVHSSRWEGLPTACLEAASLGKPLLISRETNLADAVERSEAGLVLDQTSAGGVMRGMKRAHQLYQDGQLACMGESARSLIEKEFNWAESAKGFVAAIAAASRARCPREGNGAIKRQLPREGRALRYEPPGAKRAR